MSLPHRSVCPMRDRGAVTMLLPQATNRASKKVGVGYQRRR